jgi:ABC-type phosphate transport system substrate-binding protein
MTVNVSTPARPGATHQRRVRVGAALAVIPLLAVLAACGGSSSGTPPTQAPTQGPTQAPNSGGSGGAPAIPGASGLIAAASPGTLQVQSATAQTTVVYTDSQKLHQTGL